VNEKSSHHIATALSGYELLNDPLLNNGTAFTEAERKAFDLHACCRPMSPNSTIRSNGRQTRLSGETPTRRLSRFKQRSPEITCSCAGCRIEAHCAEIKLEEPAEIRAADCRLEFL
jgi:hypothetical protein